MIDYREILEDENILSEYRKIDKKNPYSFNHGMQHIKNVVEIIVKLSEILNIDEETKNSLLIAGVLHDIGQENTRDSHGFKSRQFAEKYLKGKSNEVELDNILQAIEHHSDINKMHELSLFSNIICFADKMDFTKKRLEKNYKDRFDYIVCENIENVRFNYANDYFRVVVDIQGIKEEKAKELLLERNSFKKAIKTIIKLSNKLNAKPELYVGNIKLDLILYM